jgi:hypothetical protein
MAQHNSCAQYQEERKAYQPYHPWQEPLLPRGEAYIWTAQHKNQHQRDERDASTTDLPDRVTQALNDHLH